jgi:hypothetical protein
MSPIDNSPDVRRRSEPPVAMSTAGPLLLKELQIFQYASGFAQIDCTLGTANRSRYRQPTERSNPRNGPKRLSASEMEPDHVVHFDSLCT